MTEERLQTPSVEKRVHIPYKPGLCFVHKQHRPQPAILELHHVIPEWMQIRVFGKVMRQTKMAICPTGHTNIHVFIDHQLRGMYRPLPYISRAEKQAADIAIQFAISYQEHFPKIIRILL